MRSPRGQRAPRRAPLRLVRGGLAGEIGQEQEDEEGWGAEEAGNAPAPARALLQAGEDRASGDAEGPELETCHAKHMEYPSEDCESLGRLGLLVVAGGSACMISPHH